MKTPENWKKKMFSAAFFITANVFLQVQNNNVAPIYIINLLISDIIQFCCMIVRVAKPRNLIFNFIYYYSLLASVGFMVCIALER